MEGNIMEKGLTLQNVIMKFFRVNGTMGKFMEKVKGVIIKAIFSLDFLLKEKDMDKDQMNIPTGKNMWVSLKMI